MSEFSWVIETCERDPATGGVVVAHWRCNTSGGSAYGACTFTPDPSAPDFVPYEELTEEVVLGWVWGEVSKSEVENTLEASLTHATIVGTPW
jgi:hypothetical protein